MSLCEFTAKSDLRLRSLVLKLPPFFPAFVYSYGRKLFLSMLAKDRPGKKSYSPPASCRKTLWDIGFASNIFNAAGMFKKGEAYYTVTLQGAGAYLAGTTTARPIKGNKRMMINHPFMPYPSSHAASNWMGLPNPGHATVAKALSFLSKQEYCPIGASIAANPGLSGNEAAKGLVVGIKLYERAAVDFIEINESCPNVPHDNHVDSSGLDSLLISRLEYIAKNFIRLKPRNLPLIVKLSNDTDEALLPPLIDILTDLGFGGINLGNTSVNYQHIETMIEPSEKKCFNYFCSRFGGGVSGRPLREQSLKLASIASSYVKTKTLREEFHVIRTGGVETPQDLSASEAGGIALNQWFTGYFDGFAHSGHQVYRLMAE